jgi:5-methylcytosine-specific restriction endonuclease McrA
MSRVLVLDQQRRPLMPCTPARARLLLKQNKAAVWRRYPFTLILRGARPDAITQALRLKFDPGSRTSGLALTNDTTGEVVWAAELTHRGEQVHKALQKRAAVRRGRRLRHTRYRKPRFLNRRRPKGWLPPSLLSRVRNVETWVARLMRWCPIGALSYEVARFDTQALQNPEIAGTAYQRGTLAGYELKEYLLLKWGHRCAYCKQMDVPLQVEHLVPKSRGGSHRMSNLTLACQRCNQKKGTRTAQEFGFPHLQAQAGLPLRNAAAVNSIRWALYERLKCSGLPIETSTGGRTKWNRKQRDIPKAHWLDAANVGQSTPPQLLWQHVHPLLIRAMGQQSRQMCRMDAHGFPRTRAKKLGAKHAFRTGDIVRAVVPSHLTNKGVHVGRMAARANGAFTIATRGGTVTDIGYRYCTRLQRNDGYGYLTPRKRGWGESNSPKRV